MLWLEFGAAHVKYLEEQSVADPKAFFGVTREGKSNGLGLMELRVILARITDFSERLKRLDRY